MTTAAYRQIIAAPARDRLDLFLATANRIGAPVGNVEKDSWVCRALNALYHERPAGGPRLLFKGGTSLSKGYDLTSTSPYSATTSRSRRWSKSSRRCRTKKAPRQTGRDPRCLPCLHHRAAQ